MPQYARPKADEQSNTFVTQANATSNLYAVLNEVSANDSDYIISQKNPANNVYVCALTSVTDPLVDQGHVINFRYKKDVTVNAEQIDLIVELRQAYANEATPGTLICNSAAGAFANIPSAWTDGNIALSNAAAATISDYANLHLRFVFNKP